MIPTRMLDTGHVAGATGDTYHLIKCTGCGNFFDSHRDPGRWAKFRQVLCAVCCEGIDFTVRDTDRVAPPAELHIPEQYVQASIADFPCKVQTVARKWGFRKRGKLPFVGVAGVSGGGKTHLAYAMAMQMRDSGIRPLVINAPSARSAWINGNREALEVRWQKTPVLVLDDFTRGGQSDGWKDVITSIIDERTSNYRPTLLTCMESGKQVYLDWGAAFARRLQFFEWIKLGKKYTVKGGEDA